MADDNVGCTTRSKARSEKSAAANVTATTMRGASTSSTKGSNRSRNENILRRQRVEYEADEERAKLLEERVKLLEEQIKLRNEQSKRQAELTEVRLQIIKKKLAMQLAEIESDVEEEEQIYDIQQVDEWLNEKHKPRMSTPKNPSIHAHHAAPAQPLPAPPTPEERVVDREHDSILRLADVIVSSMSKQNKHYYDLPVFDGNPVDWLSYKRAYEMSSSSYDDYENTTRIQRSLRGEARYVVEDLLRTGAQAALIIEALQDEFGHPNRLLQNAIGKIKSLPRVSDSGVELRHITAVVRNCVYVLRNIKAEGYINNPQITQELLSKLTAGQRAQYGEYVMKLCGSDDYRISPNLNIVLDFLTHITKASSYYLPLCIDSRPKHYSIKSVNNSYNMNNVNNNMNNVKLSASNQRQNFSHRVHTAVHSRQSAKCVICDSKNHDVTKCKSFTNKSVKDRWHLVKTNNLCFKCLVQNHTSYNCTQRGCAQCNLSHHTLLHYTMPYSAARPRPQPRPAERIPRGSYEPPCEAESTSAAGFHNDARAGVCRAPPDAHAEAVTNMGEPLVNKTLLKVLPVQIYIDNKCIDTYALLDDGATVSLIDSSFVDCNKNSLRCPLKIVSARGQVITDDESCRVTALIRGPNGIQHSISLRTMKNLNLPAQTAPAEIFKQNAHLRDLNYCEMYEAKPMILIGQNHFDLIVNHEMRQGRSGQPVASRTRLGWVIHGPITNNNCNSKFESVNILCEIRNEEKSRDLCKESIDIMWNNKRSEFMQLPPKTVKTDETDVSNVQVIGDSYIRGWASLLLFLLAFWSMLRPGQPLLYRGSKNNIRKIDKYVGICKRKVSLVLYNIMWRALRHQPKISDLSPFKLRYFKQGFMNSKVKYFVYKCKRIAWKFKSLKGVISAVHPGRDNQVRLVSIKTAKGCTYNVETEC